MRKNPPQKTSLIKKEVARSLIDAGESGGAWSKSVEVDIFSAASEETTRIRLLYHQSKNGTNSLSERTMVSLKVPTLSRDRCV
jgi:hypothetical protein